MRGKWKRIVALAMSFAIATTMMPLNVFAATGLDNDTGDLVEQAGLTVTATKANNGDGTYDVAYTAVLDGLGGFASKIGINGSDTEHLKNMRVTCVLSDNLVKNITVPTAADFTESGDGAANFDLVSVNKVGNDIHIVYKLKESLVESWADSGNTAYYSQPDKIAEAIDKSMTISATQEDVDDDLLRNDITTHAWIEISYEGGNIPWFGIEKMEAAEFSGKILTGIGWPSSGSGSVTPPTKPNEFEITVEKTDGNKGSVNIGTTTGSTGTGNSGKATAGDNVSVKIDDIKKGYRAVDVIITTKNGTQIHVDRNEVNEFEFEMPKGDVTIQVVYEVSATHPDDSGVSEKLNSDQHIAFMVGDDKGTFRPNANITRAEVAQIFYALLRDKNIPTTKTFDDVDPDAWYADAVNAMASLGAVKGVGDGNFEPNRKITRAEFATIAAYFANSASDKYGFKDVSEDHWAYNFISAASRYGWVAGVGGNIFEPDRNITRAEAATIVNNMLGRMGDYDMIDAGHGRRFPDVDNSHWGWYEIIEATDSHTHSNDSEFVEEIWHD